MTMAMWSLAQSSSAREPSLQPGAVARYLVLGVPIAVGADDAQALACVDETYAGFRQDIDAPEPVYRAELIRGDGDVSPSSRPAILVRDSQGYEHEWPDTHTAVIDWLDRIVHGALAERHKGDSHAIHA